MPTGDPFGLATPLVDPLQFEDVNTTIRANAEAMAAEGAQLAAEAGLSAEGVAEPSHGSVWSTILDVAKERDAELVVAGARGHSTVRSLLLGSTSNGLVHHSHLPVLVLPAPRRDER
jgi:nucleotide-binding universal stress UspA family protein